MSIMKRKNKERRPSQWGFVDHYELSESDTMRESVIEFMLTIEEEGFSQRARSYYKSDYYAEIAKEFEVIAYAKINGKGQLFIADENKKKWCLDDYIHGKYWKETSISMFIKYIKNKTEEVMN